VDAGGVVERGATGAMYMLASASQSYLEHLILVMFRYSF
jgi:hypothetical protein